MQVTHFPTPYQIGHFKKWTSNPDFQSRLQQRRELAKQRLDALGRGSTMSRSQKLGIKRLRIKLAKQERRIEKPPTTLPPYRRGVAELLAGIQSSVKSVGSNLN